MEQTAEALSEALSRNLDALLQVPSKELLERRYERLMQYGRFKD